MLHLPEFESGTIATTSIGLILGFLIGRWSFGIRAHRLMKLMEENQRLHKLVLIDRDKYKSLNRTQFNLLLEYKKKLTLSISRLEAAQTDVRVLTVRVDDTKKDNLKLVEILVKQGVIPPQPEWFKEQSAKISSKREIPTVPAQEREKLQEGKENK